MIERMLTHKTLGKVKLTDYCQDLKDDSFFLFKLIKWEK